MQNFLVSFSGGRTSAYMTHRFLIENPNSNIKVVFANTGQEDERTLEFVKNCDEKLGFNSIWVEAEVQHEMGLGTKHKVVEFESASRGGEPYKEVIKKFGIPNKITPHCTRELKQRPITSYARSLGWGPKDYYTVIGIRSDEIDRVNARYKELNIIYPLISWGIYKADVLNFWSEQEFDLILPEHRGNCTWCWKKSYRKLFTLIEESPEIFDFPMEMEEEFSLTGSVAKRNGRPMKFFRGDLSTKDLFELKEKSKYSTFIDQRFLDITNGCSDSCEVFSE